MEAKELFLEAQLHLLRGEIEDSIKAFTRAIEAGAPEAITYLSRGAAYMKLKDADRAIEDFSVAIQKDADNARAYYYRGAARMLKDELEEAIEDLTRAIELNPENGAAFFARGTCHAQLENDDEATKDIKTALAFSETAAQSLADSMGMIRTHFDMAMALLSGERKATSMELTEEEQAKIKRWLEEDEEGHG
jgi:tetratricopeptide (TPR) repeat protein